MKRRLSFLVIMILLLIMTFGCDLSGDTDLHTSHYDADGSGFCDECGEPMENYPPEEEQHYHTFDETYVYDNFHHWLQANCEHTDEITMKSEHTYIQLEVIREPTCGEAGEERVRCTDCGYETTIYSPPIPHPKSDEWTFDEDHHWHENSCEHETANPAKYYHDWNSGTKTVEATCLSESQTVYKCKTCDAEKIVYGPRGGHIIADEYSYNDTFHYREYLCGHSGVEQYYHSYWGEYYSIKPTCTDPGEITNKCRVCDYYYTKEVKPLGHTYEETYSYDDTYHWYASDCCDGAVSKGKAEHTLGTNLECGCGYVRIPDDGLSYVFINDFTEFEVTGIADAALTEVIIPDELFGLPVTSVKEEAFLGNENIKSISIGKNVSSLGSRFAYGCTSLESISVSEENETYRIENTSLIKNSELVMALLATSIPSSVTHVAPYAFSGAKIPGTLTVPESVTSLGEWAFSDFDGGMVVFLGEIKEIPASCFYESGITEVILPDSLQNIAENAFYGCENLESVELSEALSAIGDSAFYNCRELETPNFFANLATIGEYAFFGCKSIDAIHLPSSVKSVGEYAFAECESVSEINFYGGTYGAYAFKNCKRVRSLTLTASATVYVGVFSGCTSLEEIVVDHYRTLDLDGKTYVNYFSGLFGNESKEGSSYARGGYYVPDSLRKVTVKNSYEIINAAFADCKNLQEIIIEKHNGIGKNVFSGCTSLEKLTLPCLGDNHYNDAGTTFVDTVGTANSLKEFTLLSAAYIPQCAFMRFESLERVILPDSITKINKMAFYGCINLKEINIPASLVTLDSDVFSFTDLERVYITDIEKWCELSVPSYDDAPLHGGATLYLNGEEIGGDLVIPSGTASIAIGAFYKCEGITSVTIPSSVKTIGNIAFAECKGLREINFGSGLREIGSTAFAETAITELAIPSGVTTIGAMAFDDCHELYKVTIPSSVTTVGIMAFENCYRIAEVYKLGSYSVNSVYGDYLVEHASVVHTSYNESSAIFKDENGFVFMLLEDEYYLVSKPYASGELTLPESVNGKPYHIKNHAFYENSITNVYIVDGVLTIGDSAFEKTNVTSINTNNATYIGSRCFYYSDLEEVVITSFATEIGSNVFRGCKNLTSVSWQEPADLTLGSGLFAGCTALESIAIPECVKVIGKEMFMSCSSLSDISMSDTLTEIQRYAFDGCASLKNITLPETLKSLGKGAFCGTAITSIHVPGGISTIEEGMFEECIYLESITFGAGSIVLHDSVFMGDTALCSVDFDVILDVGSMAFYDCSSLSVKLGSGLRTIGDMAYYGCKFDGKKIVIPAPVTSIGTKAFSSFTDISELVFEGSSIKTVAAEAFYGLAYLTSVTIPDAEFIGEGVFSGCSGLESITVPFVGARKDGSCEKSLTETMLAYMFGTEEYEGSYLATVSYLNEDNEYVDYLAYLPSSLKTVTVTAQTVLGNYAFVGVKHISSITLPETLTSIGTRAFYDVDSIASMKVPNSVTFIGDEAFKECGMLTGITISDSVTYIGTEAFAYCGSLRTVTIPKSVNKLASGVFYQCTSLTSVKVLGSEKWNRYSGSSVRAVSLSDPELAAKNFVYEYPTAFWVKITSE